MVKSFPGAAFPARTDVLVVGSGYTGPLTPWLRRRLVPTESLMIATEELPADVAGSLIPKGRMIYDSKIFLYYNGNPWFQPLGYAGFSLLDRIF